MAGFKRAAPLDVLDEPQGLKYAAYALPSKRAKAVHCGADSVYARGFQIAVEEGVAALVHKDVQIKVEREARLAAEMTARDALAEVAKLKAELANKEQEVSFEKAAKHQAETGLQSLQGSVENLQTQDCQRKNEIARHSAALHDMQVQNDANIEEARGVVAQKDQEIAGLRDWQTQHKQDVANLRDQIGWKNEEIDSLKNKSALQEQAVTALGAEMERRQGQKAEDFQRAVDEQCAEDRQEYLQEKNEMSAVVWEALSEVDQSKRLISYLGWSVEQSRNEFTWLRQQGMDVEKKNRLIKALESELRQHVIRVENLEAAMMAEKGEVREKNDLLTNTRERLQRYKAQYAKQAYNLEAKNEAFKKLDTESKRHVAENLSMYDQIEELKANLEVLNDRSEQTVKQLKKAQKNSGAVNPWEVRQSGKGMIPPSLKKMETVSLEHVAHKTIKKPSEQKTKTAKSSGFGALGSVSKRKIDRKTPIMSEEQLIRALAQMKSGKDDTDMLEDDIIE